MRLKKSDWIAISVFLLSIFIICLWCIDVSVSAAISQGYCTNGIYNVNPIITYHLALYSVIIVMFANTLIVIHLARK